TSALPVLETDIGPPNMGLNLRQRYRFLFRVRLSGNRVACEFAHILSDGTGCMAFLKALLAEYFRILGVTSTPLPGDVRVGDTPSAEEHEDAYHRYYRPGVPPPGKQGQAYHIDSKLLPKGQYRVTCGVVSVEGLSAQAKSRGVSINDLVVAAYMDALITTRQAELDAGKKPRPVVSLEVPVNLRKFYPTKTLRNFSLFALPAIDLRPGGFSFDELVKRAHHLMRLEGDERRMATHVSRNARAGRSIMIRLVPVWLKDFFARLFFESMGEGMMSGMLSNLGPVSMPQELEAHIERFDFVGAPSTIIKTGASMLSWKGMAYISFHSLAQSRDVERLFFSRLAWLGLDVRVESSMEV
ncbi:MAG TPA: hypothetical protein PLC54_08720, partial [Spirochaetales bacterium]|nr:hypothetical protein [Spirochaetales bacterium]